MVIEPKIRKNLCLTAHPLGCARQVHKQIDYVKARTPIPGPFRALVIGGSNGYGLAARIMAAYGCGALTYSVAFERPGSPRKPGTAGWYNDRAFLETAQRDKLHAWSLNGDAFAPQVKEQAIREIKERMGKLDLVVYSIASPRRLDPKTGILHSSVIKPIGGPFVSKTLDFQTGMISDVRAEPVSSKRQIEDTVKVMGGEDWALWIQALHVMGLLEDRVTTVAFSYIGPQLTFPIYRDGTIGLAKEHLEATARRLNRWLSAKGGRALVSVNKALVTRASAVIPAVPLYLALLYRVMKEKGLHEECIHQMYRLFGNYLYSPLPLPLDPKGRIRLDDLEMRPDVQAEVSRLWEIVTTENIERISDIEGFRAEYLRYHGFGVSGIDYSADVES